ncbi:hypothetical protein E5672_19445 [Alteromonas portus]|uniref:Uncharacterized protein n=2 Tax=Alteromonas portus TaxID=2565549 RepID=A0A4U0ZDA0_9ALTE|nr:hypothetical protein E5672_19445 [Alteromonas portus]
MGISPYSMKFIKALKNQKLKKKKALTSGGLKTPTIEKHRQVGGNERGTGNKPLSRIEEAL